MDSLKPTLLVPQNQVEVKIWAEDRQVMIQMETGHWLQLTPRGARQFANEITKKADEAEHQIIVPVAATPS